MLLFIVDKSIKLLVSVLKGQGACHLLVQLILSSDFVETENENPDAYRYAVAKLL